MWHIRKQYIFYNALKEPFLKAEFPSSDMAHGDSRPLCVGGVGDSRPLCERLGFQNA